MKEESVKKGETHKNVLVFSHQVETLPYTIHRKDNAGNGARQHAFVVLLRLSQPPLAAAADSRT